MTTLQKTIVTATVAVLAGAGIYEARQASTLRTQIQTIREQQSPMTEQIQQLSGERDEATRQLAALRDENERLSRNTDELLRLRGEVGTLRRQLAEHSKSSSQSAAQFFPAAQPNDPVLQTKQMGRDKTFDGRNYAVQFIMFAEENKGWLPTNWQQVAKYQENFAVSGTNEFEMVHQSPLNRNQLGTNVWRTALVREYLAWPTPDGRWGRIYGFADGHSQVVFLKDGDFDAWEQQNIFNPHPAAE